MHLLVAPRPSVSRLRKKLFALSCAAAAGLTGSRVYATTYSWVDPTSGGNWSVAANWSPNSAAPFVGDTALFHSNSSSAFTLNFDYVLSGTGLTLLDIDPFGTGNLIFSQTNSSTSMIAGSEIVGNFSDGAAVAVYNQGINTTNSPLLLTVGFQSGGNGIYNLGGGFMNIGALYVGSASASVGVFNMTSGQITAGGLAIIGNAGTGTFSQTNGTTTFNQGLTIAAAGGKGVFNLSGGSVSSTQNEYIGFTSGNGTFNQSGGTHTANNLEIAWSGGNGTYTLSSGLLTVNGTDVNIGRSGVGTFNQSAGTANLSGFYLGALGSGTGTVNLSGGQMNLTNTAYLGGYSGGAGGAGMLKVSGGTLTTPGDLHIYNTDSGTNHSGINLSANGVINTASVTTPDWSRVSLAGGSLNFTTGVSSNTGTLSIGAGTATATVTLAGGGLYATDLAVGPDGPANYLQFSGTAGFSSGVSVGRNASGKGGVTIFGGTFTTPVMSLGEQGGAGTFAQVGGTVTVNSGLYISLIPSGSGTYSLQGGVLNAGTLLVADGAGGITGTFSQIAGTANFTGTNQNQIGGDSASGGEGTGTWTQIGGTANFKSGLAAGGGSSSVGTILLSGNAIVSSSNSLVIGDLGTATMTQSGGTVTVTAGATYLGKSSGGQGTLNLSFGSFTTPQLFVGNVGSGTVSQSGGVLTASGGLFIAPNASSRGNYALSTGTLSAGSLVIGNDTAAVGTFNQSGGTATFHSAFLGSISAANGTGTYNLSNGATVTFSGPASVGGNGNGTWNQTGGTANFNGGMSISTGAAGGTVTLSGGTLSSTDIELNNGGHFNLSLNGTNVLTYSTFNQNGGAFSATSREFIPIGATYTQTGGSNNVDNGGNGGLFVAFAPGGSGTYSISNGSLVAGRIGIGSDDTGKGGDGVFNQSGGTVSVTSGFFGLALAGQSSGSAVYNLNGGTLNVNAVETIGGQNAPGTFNQTNGAHTVTGSLMLLNLGTFNLNGGSLTSGSMQLNSGSTFNYNAGTLQSSGGVTQTGGSFSFGGQVDLYIDSAQGLAHYNLSGGSMTGTGDTDEIVGSNATGTFTQSGGTNTAFAVEIGGNFSGNGTYTLSNGNLNSTYVELANGSVAAPATVFGTLNQSGGQINTATLDAGSYSGTRGVGIINLSGGTLNATNLVPLGGFGTQAAGVGILNVSGGTLTASSGIQLYATDIGSNHTAINLSGSGVITTTSIASPDWARLNFAGGTLNLTSGISSNTGALTIGTTGNATLNQSGGSLSTTMLYLGFGPASTGSYSLSNGASLAVTGPVFAVATQGVAAFTQTGGTVSSPSELEIAQDPNSSGSYTLGAGSLTVGVEDIGNAGAAMFTQTGGTQSASMLVVAAVFASSGTFTQSGGQTILSGPVYVGGTSFGPGGAATVNLNGGTFNAGSNTITIYDTGSGFNQTAVNVQGGSLTAGNVVNNSYFSVISGGATVGAVSGTGSTNVGGATAATTLSLTSFTQANVEIDQNGTLLVAPSATTPFTNTATTLIISGGRLNLGNNNLVTSTPTSTIQSYLKSGYNAGHWNGASGITSSSAASAFGTGNDRSLGYASSTDHVAGSVVIPSGQTLVKYTTPGDADLSGTTDFNDFLALQNNYNQPGNWSQGDWNYSGTVDFNDYLILQNNYNHKLNANGSAAGSAKTAASKLTASGSVTGPATVTYMLVKNDDGTGHFTAGSFAVYAVDTTADGNQGLAAYELDVKGFSTISNFAPAASYFSGGKVLGEGFSSFRSADTGENPVKGSQDTTDANVQRIVYGFGQTAGSLDSTSGSDLLLAATQQNYGAPLLLATGTFSDPNSLLFNSDNTFDQSNVFLANTGTATEGATITLQTQTLSGVPEPTSLGLIALALGGMLARRKRRK